MHLYFSSCCCWLSSADGSFFYYTPNKLLSLMSSFCFAVGFDIMVMVIIMKNEGSLASQCSLQQYTNEKSYVCRTALQVHYIT